MTNSNVSFYFFFSAAKHHPWHGCSISLILKAKVGSFTLGWTTMAAYCMQIVAFSIHDEKSRFKLI